MYISIFQPEDTPFGLGDLIMGWYSLSTHFLFKQMFAIHYPFLT